jgi:pimeloyl-ACP methyl ester carboxylesterase
MFKKILIGIGLLVVAAIVIPYVWIGMGDKPFNDEARALAPGEFAELSDGKLHYVWVEPAPETANGETVIMLHGLYVPHFMFAQNAEGLAGDGYRVLLPDHYGHGFSDRPRGKYDAALFERELSGLVSELDLDTPFFLAGQSTGGMIATQYTAAHPEQVKGVMLIVPAGLRMHGEADDPMSKLLRAPAVGDWMWRILARPALRKPVSPPCEACGIGKLLGDHIFRRHIADISRPC